MHIPSGILQIKQIEFEPVLNHYKCSWNWLSCNLYK